MCNEPKTHRLSAESTYLSMLINGVAKHTRTSLATTIMRHFRMNTLPDAKKQC